MQQSFGPSAGATSMHAPHKTCMHQTVGHKAGEHTNKKGCKHLGAWIQAIGSLASAVSCPLVFAVFVGMVGDLESLEATTRYTGVCCTRGQSRCSRGSQKLSSAQFLLSTRADCCLLACNKPAAPTTVHRTDRNLAHKPKPACANANLAAAFNPRAHPAFPALSAAVRETAAQLT